MNSLQSYRMLWNKNKLRGNFPSVTFDNFSQWNFASWNSLLLLEAGIISPMDLQGMRLLLESSGYAEDGKKAELLEFFLSHMYGWLNEGNVRLGDIEENNQISIEKDCALQMERALSLLSEKRGEEENVLHSQFIDVNRLLVEQECESYSKRFCELVTSGEFSGLLEKFNPELAENNFPSKPILYQVENSPGFYFQKFALAKSKLFGQLKKLAEAPKLLQDEVHILDALEELLHKSPLMLASNTPLQMNKEQISALTLAANYPLCIITGGPGTGKTTIALNVLRLLRRLRNLQPKDIALCAPTGRAAARLQESIQLGLQSLSSLNPGVEEDLKLQDVYARTLHGTLGFQPGKSHFKHHVYNPLPHKLVIVDEASMVDLVLFQKLLDALPADASLILMGDKNQLPSVNAGMVLGELAGGIDSNGKQMFPQRVVELRESRRSTPEILELAESIKSGNDMGFKIDKTILVDTSANQKSMLLPQGPAWIQLNNTNSQQAFHGALHFWTDNIYFNNNNGQDILPEILEKIYQLSEGVEWAEATFTKTQETLNNSPWQLLNMALEYLEKGRCLCFHRRGFFGVQYINDYMMALMVKKLPQFMQSFSTTKIFSGMPIVLTSNHPHLKLFNGDTGMLIQTRAGHRVYFKKFGNIESFPLGEFSSWEAAYASTVHKAQGSEYENVLLVLPQKFSRLMSREIFYTALTRAKNFVGLFGTEEMARRCIREKILRKS